MNIYLGKSLAGHDKNHIYIIYKEEKEFYFLVNGSTKTIDAPKKKNKKHIQIIKHLPGEVKTKADRLSSMDELVDSLAAEIVECYSDYINSKIQYS